MPIITEEGGDETVEMEIVEDAAERQARLEREQEERQRVLSKMRNQVTKTNTQYLPDLRLPLANISVIK